MFTTIPPIGYSVLPLIPGVLPTFDDIDIINYVGPKTVNKQLIAPSNILKYIVVTSDYKVSTTDQYIGIVTGDEPITITLPEQAASGMHVFIKLQSGPPIGKYKIKIVDEIDRPINGSASIHLSVPYQSISLIFIEGTWFTI